MTSCNTNSLLLMLVSMYHLRQIRIIRYSLSSHAVNTLVHALICSVILVPALISIPVLILFHCRHFCSSFSSSL